MGIHIMDVIDASDHPNSSGQIDWAVCNADLLGHSRQRAATVCTKNGVTRQKWLKYLRYVNLVVNLKNEVGGATRAITADQHSDLLLGRSALGGLAAPFARCARTLAATFVRFQKKCLINLRYPDKPLSLHGLSDGKKTMPPPECGTLSNM
jgi:hypothetical protein